MTRLRRTVALIASAALLASLTASTVAAPTSAATPKCRGFVATIVGTKGPDVLVGTARRDVIVGRGGNDVINGRGGNDIICGGPGADRLIGKGGRDFLFGNGGSDRLSGGVGNDRLFGGVGNDRLYGQVGSDLLGGGPGTDTCYQGQGPGRAVSCELPAAPPPPAPAPPPPPPPDTDGDGIIDANDACPNKGDQGYGVGTNGCPNPPMTTEYNTGGPGQWVWIGTWSGLEPGAPVTVTVVWAGVAPVFVEIKNTSGAGSEGVYGPCSWAGGEPLESLTLTATVAGYTEQQYPLPLPPSSICP
jgi:hypothetical protein